MSGMTYSLLFLTLSRGGWGEAAFGIYLAEQLRARGHDITFLTHSSNMRLFENSGFGITKSATT